MRRFWPGMIFFSCILFTSPDKLLYFKCNWKGMGIYKSDWEELKGHDYMQLYFMW